ncbi:MAG: GNAT family N-acetyltransferase [Armatimonadetes bacterium]|nr:GNAT family N-acetyltransferase [Armatimonadota bacterium]
MLISPLTHETVPKVADLQRVCFPPPFPADLLWTRDQLESHLQVFPEGQFVATADGEVIGSASSLVIDEDNWTKHADWETTVGGHRFSRHSQFGTTLYGADVSVRPDWRGRGVARALYKARFDLVCDMGLVRFGTACRIPDWLTWSSSNPGQDQFAYCQAVASGTVTDRTMTPLVRIGLSLVDIAIGHMEDPESGNSAAILEWRP